MRVQCGAKAAHHVGPVIIVLHVLFAREDELHRSAGQRHRGFHGVIEKIEEPRQTPAEAAAHRQKMEANFVERQVCGFGASQARSETVLRAAPYFERAVPVERRRVHRLHRRVREIGHLIGCLDDARA